MKKLLVLSTMVLFALSVFAQKHNKNGKWKDKNDRNNEWNTWNNRNIPKKVQKAFNKDYPNANNVQWSKERGYYIAKFGSGFWGNKNTVAYKSNGKRVNNYNYPTRRDRDNKDWKNKRDKDWKGNRDNDKNDNDRPKDWDDIFGKKND